MTVNLDKAVEIAQDMLNFSDEISKKHLLTRMGIQEARAHLMVGSAQISQMCAALMMLAKQQEGKKDVQSDRLPDQRKRDAAEGKKPKRRNEEAGEAGELH